MVFFCSTPRTTYAAYQVYTRAWNVNSRVSRAASRDASDFPRDPAQHSNALVLFSSLFSFPAFFLSVHLIHVVAFSLDGPHQMRRGSTGHHSTLFSSVPLFTPLLAHCAAFGYSLFPLFFSASSYHGAWLLFKRRVRRDSSGLARSLSIPPSSELVPDPDFCLTVPLGSRRSSRRTPSFLFASFASP